MNTTPFYFSRTFWVNAVALLSLVLPDVRAWLDANPVGFGAALAALNVLLKFVTVGKHEIKDDQPNPVSQTPPDQAAANDKAVCSSSITKLSLIGMLGIASLLVTPLLASCGHSVTYSNDGGLVVSKDGVIVTIHKAYPDTPPVKILPAKK